MQQGGQWIRKVQLSAAHLDKQSVLPVTEEWVLRNVISVGEKMHLITSMPKDGLISRKENHKGRRNTWRPCKHVAR